MTSSIPTPIGCPVNPFVLATTISLAAGPKAFRSAATSAAALPPRAGVNVSCDMKTVDGAIACRLIPNRRSAEVIRLSTTPEMWSTSRRVPWKALFRVSVARSSTIPRHPRSSTASWLSTTRAQAPIPMMVPWRRRSNGRAASSTLSSVAAAPEARNPAPIQGSILSPVATSAPRTRTRRQRPLRIQSSAMAIAWAVEAQAELTWAFGPRAPTYSANWLCPMARIRKRNRRSNSYGSRSSSSVSAAILRCSSRSPSLSRM